MATVTPVHTARATPTNHLRPQRLSVAHLAATAAAMITTVVLAAVTTHAVTTSAGAAAPYAWMLSLAVAALLAITGWRLVALAWRGVSDGGLAGGVVDASVIALMTASLVTGHYGHLIGLGMAFIAFCGIAAVDPSAIAQYLRHAWWTPAGASRQATALTAVDAADHAQSLLRDPRLDGATTNQLVRVFVHDARVVAADAVSDARDSLTRAGRFSCTVCGTNTDTEPCARHQPFLHADRTN